jgi:transcriptional antiterminator RfaH
MERRWAVLRSQARRETVAARSVNARGIETYVPWMPRLRHTETARPLFPGYLFAHISPETDELLRVRSAPGVSYVLPRAGTPALLPESFVEAIRSHEQAVSVARRRGFSRGDRVLVTSGPFKWVEGLFDRSLSTSGRVRILLNLVHRTVAVQIGATELAPTEDRVL